MSTSSERLRGHNGLYLTLTPIGGGTTFVADKDVKAATLDPEDKDDSGLTFADAASGNTKDLVLNLTAVQSDVADSLHQFLTEHPGEEFDVVLGFWGNAVPTAAKPHRKFQAKSDGVPQVGGAATRKDKAGWEFEYAMEVTTASDAIVIDRGV